MKHCAMSKVSVATTLQRCFFYGNSKLSNSIYEQHPTGFTLWLSSELPCPFLPFPLLWKQGSVDAQSQLSAAHYHSPMSASQTWVCYLLAMT